MADGIYYDSSNKQLKFTVSGSNVLTLASGSGIQFNTPITASSITISSSTTSSVFTVMGRDANSTAKMIWPISETASYFMEVMSGSDLGDFRFGASGSIAGGINGIQTGFRVFTGGARNFKKIAFFSNNTESFSMNDSGSVVVGNTGSTTYFYIDYPNSRIGFNTLTPGVAYDVFRRMNISGNLLVTGSLSVGFSSTAATGSTGKNVIQVSGNIIPYVTGSGITASNFDLGSASLVWNDIYATNGTINTSDRDLKTDIYPSDLGIDFVNSLKPVSYKFNNGSSGRTHYGLIAQDIEELLPQFNKTTADFAGFIKNRNQKLVRKELVEAYDTISGTIEYITSSYLEMIDDTDKQYTYALRYTEFISPMIKAVQELSKKLEELESKLSSSNK